MERLWKILGTTKTGSCDKYADYVIKPNFKDGYPFSKKVWAAETEKNSRLRKISQYTMTSNSGLKVSKYLS